MHDVKSYLWDDPLLFRRCGDGIIRRCVPENEFESILWHCHGSDYGGHFSVARTASKVLQSGFYWPTLFKDARGFIEKCLLQLDELDEFRLQAYENASIYKERTKKWHDKRIVHRKLTSGQHVLLYNTRLKLFPGKLKSRWSGPFVVKQVFPFGTVEISDLN